MFFRWRNQKGVKWTSLIKKVIFFWGELKTVKERDGYNQFAKEIGSEKK